MFDLMEANSQLAASPFSKFNYFTTEIRTRSHQLLLLKRITEGRSE